MSFYHSDTFILNYFQDQQPYMHNPMPPTTQPNWNNEGTKLSYRSAATMEEFHDDMVDEFMNPRNDVETFYSTNKYWWKS